MPAKDQMSHPGWMLGQPSLHTDWEATATSAASVPVGGQPQIALQDKDVSEESAPTGAWHVAGGSESPILPPKPGPCMSP